MLQGSRPGWAGEGGSQREAEAGSRRCVCSQTKPCHVCRRQQRLIIHGPQHCALLRALQGVVFAFSSPSGAAFASLQSLREQCVCVCVCVCPHMRAHRHHLLRSCKARTERTSAGILSPNPPASWSPSTHRTHQRALPRILHFRPRPHWSTWGPPTRAGDVAATGPTSPLSGGVPKARAVSPPQTGGPLRAELHLVLQEPLLLTWVPGCGRRTQFWPHDRGGGALGSPLGCQPDLLSSSPHLLLLPAESGSVTHTVG